MIRKAPDKILTTPCQKLTKETYTKILSKFVMRNIPHRKNGVGISANQVGIPYALFTMIMSNKVGWVYCLNPEIVQFFGKKIKHSEGCLSIPGKSFKVERSTHIEVKYRDIKWKKQNTVLDGLDAIIFQHEFDHINAVSYTHLTLPTKAKV